MLCNETIFKQIAISYKKKNRAKGYDAENKLILKVSLDFFKTISNWIPFDSSDTISLNNENKIPNIQSYKN